MEPQPCQIAPEVSEDGGTVLLWESIWGVKKNTKYIVHRPPFFLPVIKDKSLRISIDAIVTRNEVVNGILQMDCEGHDLPVAHVKWQRISNRAALQAIYDALVIHGVPIYPPHRD